MKQLLILLGEYSIQNLTPHNINETARQQHGYKRHQIDINQIEILAKWEHKTLKKKSFHKLRTYQRLIRVRVRQPPDGAVQMEELECSGHNREEKHQRLEEPVVVDRRVGKRKVFGGWRRIDRRHIRVGHAQRRVAVARYVAAAASHRVHGAACGWGGWRNWAVADGTEEPATAASHASSRCSTGVWR